MYKILCCSLTLIVTTCLSSLVLAWPVTMTLDTTKVDYRSASLPQTLSCAFELINNGMTELSQNIEVRPHAVDTYTYQFRTYEDDFRKLDYQNTLSCKVAGDTQPGRLISFTCYDVTFDGAFKIADAIDSKKCIVHYE